jgi:adenylate cyclase
MSALPVTEEESTPAAGAAAERRQAVILFARLRGFTRMTDMLEPERVVRLAAEFFAITQKIVEANGGETVSTQNDSLLATFRYGTPSELVRHAITAAQAVQYGFSNTADDWQRDYGLTAAVSMGLHLGNVVYGSMGPTGHARFIALGDAVNVANRLVHRARAGEFVLSDSMMGVLQVANLELDAQPLPALQVARGPSIGIYGVCVETRLDFT